MKLRMLINKYVLGELIVLICIFVNFIYTHATIMQIGWQYVFYPTIHIGFILFEVSSIYFISLAFGKWRWHSFIFLYYIETIVLWINVGYSRYFNTYLPLSLYNEYNNLNGLLPNIVDAIEYNDILFLITTVTVTVSYILLIKLPKPHYHFVYPLILALTIVALLIPYYSSMLQERNRLRYHFSELNDHRTTWDVIKYRIRTTRESDIRACSYYYGIGLNLLYEIYDKYLSKTKIEYSAQEEQMIKAHINATSYDFASDRPKNMIILIIESLSSYPIKKTFDGFEITPTINKLLSEAYYNPNMKSEALLGESSDGQYIYLTGLLPLKNTITINEIHSDTIISIISLDKTNKNKLYTQMVIPTNSNTWSQQIMCKRYGIDHLYSKEQYSKEIGDWLNDEQLFDFAASKNDLLKTPFISIILTSSMHSPYNQSLENYEINYPHDFSEEFKHYLDNVHYMDKYLGKYIQSLKDHQLYEESTIIIVADHKPNQPKLNYDGEEDCTLLPLIIVNPPLEYKGITDTKPINQSCLFPTILDLLEIKSDWRGVGQSIFMPDSILYSPYEKERQKMKQTISDYIFYKSYL